MIILAGVAGSGKSVQGRLLTNNYGYVWVSTGEMLRKFSSDEQKAQMLKGVLLSDKEMIKVIEKAISRMDLSKQLVLDGFPRTIAQSDWLLDQVKKGKLTITAVINLKASEKAVLNRLLQRGRADDSAEAIKQRFNEYRKITLPILDHLKKAGIGVYDVDAEQDPGHVHSAIVQAIHNAKNKS